MHQKLANSTFRIECGFSSGSGFSFKRDSIVVTNHHVIEPNLLAGSDIFVISENGVKLQAEVISFSDKTKYDFAILKLSESLPPGRTVLQSKINPNWERGSKIIFAGFPHGIHKLLIHEAIISGPAEIHSFFIDGSVNGGNSGGPIVDYITGELIGIITQRRFFGQQPLQSLGKNAAQLAQYCDGIANKGSVQIMGIDFREFANLMAQSLNTISQAIELNANSGIGIGFKMNFLQQEYDNFNCEKKARRSNLKYFIGLEVWLALLVLCHFTDFD